MNSRATRGRRSRDRRRQQKNLARRRQLFKRVTWLSGIAVVLIAVVVGGIIYAGGRSPAEPELSPITGLQIGNLNSTSDLLTVGRSIRLSWRARINQCSISFLPPGERSVAPSCGA